MPARQICIIGGSFNPIHTGHLQMARSAQAQCMADEVWFLPAGQPWQKSNTDLAPAKIRKYMVELATQDVPSWRVEPFEVEQEGPSYTVNTLEYLSTKYPDYQFCFVVGTDQLANLHTWKHWQSLFDYARIGVVDRDQLGAFVVPDVLKQHQVRDRLFRIPMPRIAVSSTDIRRQFAFASSANQEIRETAVHRLKAGLPPPVYEYLKVNPVYGRLLG